MIVQLTVALVVIFLVLAFAVRRPLDSAPSASTTATRKKRRSRKKHAKTTDNATVEESQVLRESGSSDDEPTKVIATRSQSPEPYAPPKPPRTVLRLVPPIVEQDPHSIAHKRRVPTELTKKQVENQRQTELRKQAKQELAKQQEHRLKAHREAQHQAKVKEMIQKDIKSVHY